MPTYTVTIARDQSEYAEVTIDANSPEEAEAEITRIFVNDRDYGQEYCELVNNASWDSGDETTNERIIDVEEAS